MTSYADIEPLWRAYEPHLPPALRLGDDLPTEERFAWRDCDVHLDRYAKPDAGTTVIVLHGGGGNGRLLASFGKLIAEAGHETVMPDLPGYGVTTAPKHQVRYEAWVGLVADLARAETDKGRKVFLVGASMGGMLAWHAAAALPQGAIAGVAATTLIDAREPDVRRATARMKTTANLSVRLLTATRHLTDNVRVPMPWVGDVDGIANDPGLTKAVKNDTVGGGNRVPLGFLRSWMTYAPALEPEAFDRCPVLLAHPGDDRWTPTALSLAFFDRLPGPKRFVELENCGHVPIEEPGLTTLTAELAAFLRGEPGPR